MRWCWAIVPLFVALGIAVLQPAQAQTAAVCFKQDTELDLLNKADNANTLAKLQNSAYFGTSGNVAPESLTFSALGSVTSGSLAACDVFLGGGFEGELTAAEGSALTTWADGTNGFVIGGCDLASNPTCTSFGKSLTQISNPNINVNGALAFNPVTCGGAGSIGTFGGVASEFGNLDGDDVILGTYDGSGTTSIIADNLTTPRFFMVGDADTLGSSGSDAIGAGATASSNQAIFVLNTMKFALDALNGRLTNPQCLSDYNQDADLEFSIGIPSIPPAEGETFVLSFTVTNTEASTSVTDVNAQINLPGNLTYVSDDSGGSFDDSTGVWTIGNLAADTSVVLQVTVEATFSGTNNVSGEIINSSLADPDSSPNSGLAADDQKDGDPNVIDDDEDQVSLSVRRAFSCDNTLYQLANSGATQLKEIAFNGATANFNDIGPSAGRNVNGAWGYNVVDDFIYGFRSNSSRELLRVDADGNFDSLGTIPAALQAGPAGDVLPDGQLVYRADGDTFGLIDLTASPATFTGSFDLNATVNVIDMAYNDVDGNIYFIDGTRDQVGFIEGSSTINNTRTVTFFGPSDLTGSYGAQWFDEVGNFFFYDNNTNEFFVMDVGVNGNGTGQVTLISTSTNDEEGNNDGAFCRGPSPVPLGLIQGRLYEDEDGNDTRESGEPFLPSGITVSLFYDQGTATTSDDIFVSSTETGANGLFVFFNLVVFETYRVEVDAADPQIPSGFTNGTANPVTGVTVQDKQVTMVDFGFDDDPGTITLSGTVFQDNGTGTGATAHNGTQEGTETGLAGIKVEVFDATDTAVIGTALTPADGSWTIEIDAAHAGTPLPVRTSLLSGYRFISEAGTPPASAQDGETTVTPASGATLTGLDFGQIRLPALIQDTAISAEQGSAVSISHQYTSFTSGDITLTLEDEAQTPTGIFSSTLILDTNCSGAIEPGEAPVTAPVPAVAGETICVVVRHVVAAGAPPGALLTYTLQAVTAFTGTPEDTTLTNADQVTVASAGSGAATLEKQVCNITINSCDISDGSGFSAQNTGTPGDIMQYRIIFTVTGPETVSNVTIFDRTPDFTFLKAGTAEVVVTPPVTGLSCQLITPAGGGVEGFEGNIEWACSGGAIPPGSVGVVGFRVEIE